jgi:hypothetical protein
MNKTPGKIYKNQIELDFYRSQALLKLNPLTSSSTKLHTANISPHKSDSQGLNDTSLIKAMFDSVSNKPSITSLITKIA